jgi:ankyrin repeat protein
MTLAAEVGNAEMLKVLLEAGANADSPNPDGQTALLAVARTGNVEAAQVLLQHGATVDAKEKWGGQTALMWASARRHPEMMQLLISKGADVNARSIDRNYQRHIQAEGRPKNLDSGGFTPLLYAARENCAACVKVLLDNKADIDLPDPDSVSPLLVAIMNANWDLAKQLIEPAPTSTSGTSSARRRCSPRSTCARASTVDGHPSMRRIRPRASRSSSCCSIAAPIPTCSCSSSRRTRGAWSTRVASRR